MLSCSLHINLQGVNRASSIVSSAQCSLNMSLQHTIIPATGLLGNLNTAHDFGQASPQDLTESLLKRFAGHALQTLAVALRTAIRFV